MGYIVEVLGNVLCWVMLGVIALFIVFAALFGLVMGLEYGVQKYNLHGATNYAAEHGLTDVGCFNDTCEAKDEKGNKVYLTCGFFCCVEARDYQVRNLEGTEDDTDR